MSQEELPMAAKCDDQHGDSGRESHIREIRQRLDELSDGHMVTEGTEALPLEEQEKFWCRVLAFENGPSRPISSA